MATPIFYRVIAAKGVNMRTSPSKAGKIIIAIEHDAMVSRIDDATVPSDWFRISWNGREGFAASAYLAPVSNAPTTDPSHHGSELVWPPAPAVGIADRDPARLHPSVRKAVLDTLADLQARGINFRIHEAFRTPERQAWLYASGRTRPGAKITNAQPWQSMHQYGLAADLVLFTDKGWSWDTSGANAAKWAAMHAAAKTRGLKPLSFELPHVEPVNANWQRSIAGDLPPGGDEGWWESVGVAAERWHQSGRLPHGPALRIGERPALEEA